MSTGTIEALRPHRLTRRHMYLICALFTAHMGLFFVGNYAATGGLSLAPHWDSDWYRSIAERGYWLSDPTYSEQQPLTFFPLYPLLARLLATVTTLSQYPAMVLTSAICTLASSMLVFRFTLHFFSERIAALTTAFFLLNPFSIYLLNGYSEALFSLLAIGSLHYLAVRPNYFIAAVLIGLASATRPFGFVLVIPFLGELLFRHIREHGVRPTLSRELRAAIAYTPICFMGIVGYSLFLHLQFGDPLAVVKANKAWHTGEETAHWTTGIFRRTILQLTRETGYVTSLKEVSMRVFVSTKQFGICLFTATIALVVLLAKRLPRVVVVYGLGLIAFVIYKGGDVNLGRYTTFLFSLPMCLALLVGHERSEPADIRDAEDTLPTWVNLPAALILTVFACLLVFYSQRFFNGKWVS